MSSRRVSLSDRQSAAPNPLQIAGVLSEFSTSSEVIRGMGYWFLAGGTFGVLIALVVAFA